MKALITGGSKGIGLAIKKALEAEGIECISWSRKEGVDLDKAMPFLPAIDILINNVGMRGSWVDAEREQMHLNYFVMVDLIKQFLKLDKKWGRVITISSIFGKEKGINPGFTAAKSAQIAYMKSLAGTCEGITFNTICPGYTNTKPEIKDYAQGAPIVEPEDVANLVAFLCSNKADNINGAVITVDGGFSHSF